MGPSYYKKLGWLLKQLWIILNSLILLVPRIHRLAGGFEMFSRYVFPIPTCHDGPRLLIFWVGGILHSSEVMFGLGSTSLASLPCSVLVPWKMAGWWVQMMKGFISQGADLVLGWKRCMIYTCLACSAKSWIYGIFDFWDHLQTLLKCVDTTKYLTSKAHLSRGSCRPA